MSTTNQQFDVTAVGRVASAAQVPLSQLLEVASRLGIKPVGRINGVDYFDAPDIQALLSHIRSHPGSVNQEPFY